MKPSHITLWAKVALFVATIIWGTTFFLMEGAIQSIGIFTLLSVRFIVAALILALILSKQIKSIDKGYIIRGFIMGLLVITAYILQTYGLADEGTTPGKNAFLTATYCIIVPFLAWAFSGQRPDRYNITAAVMCIFGITLISVSGNDFKSICAGDILTLLGGVFFSFHMIAVSLFSKGRNVLLLTMLQFLFAGIISLVPAIILEKLPAHFSPAGCATLLYLTVMATCLCYILQNVGQKYTHPSTASLILSLESVFGVLFSVIFTSEKITPRLFFGFATVFLAIIISEIKPTFFKKTPQN